MKKFKIKFRFEILLLFVILEVIFFEENSKAQSIISLLEYVFLAFTILQNKRIGIMYYVSFTILALSQENFTIQDTLPTSFWGLRALGFSVNILFSFLALIYCLYTDKKRESQSINSYNTTFLTNFILYSLFIGIISLAINDVYTDNFIKDVFTYIPYFIYLFLLKHLDFESLKKIIKYGLPATLIMAVLSLTTSKMFQYGTGNYFVLANTVSFILPFAVVILRKNYSKIQFSLISATLIFLIISGNMFIGGKQIILLVFILIWFSLSSWKIFIPLSVLILSIFLSIDYIFEFMINHYSESIISFKFSQIYEAYKNFDIKILAFTHSSMGNIVAEGVTLSDYLLKNERLLIFGKGFGGGIPDTFGYLSPWAGQSGYAYHDLIRDDFHKLHLPLYEITLKSGLPGFIYYAYILTKNFTAKNEYNFIYLLLLFFVFYVTKEQLLLALTFLMLAQKNKIEENDHKLQIQKQ